jgi:hypothetical protein
VVWAARMSRVICDTLNCDCIFERKEQPTSLNDWQARSTRNTTLRWPHRQKHAEVTRRRPNTTRTDPDDLS